jgi:hypothetical protein
MNAEPKFARKLSSQRCELFSPMDDSMQARATCAGLGKGREPGNVRV